MESEIKGLSLKVDTLLNQTYRIEKIMSISELSIIYLTQHVEDKTRHVMKEFFPKTIALRDLDHKTVLCRKSSLHQKFEELREAFLNEAQMIEDLNHKNIVGYVDYFRENGTSYIVMEYCQGKTLSQYIMEGYNVHLTKFFGRSLLPLIDAVRYIHKQGIIHRDIKPSNILIGEHGHPWIIDFGSAIYYKQCSKQTIFTTPGFSPLELYSEKSRQGVYSDIYSLSATIYYFLSGRIPVDISERLIEDKLQNIKSLNRKVTPILAKVIMWGLTVDYKRRCSSLQLFKTVVYVEHLRLKMKSSKEAIEKK